MSDNSSLVRRSVNVKKNAGQKSAIARKTLEVTRKTVSKTVRTAWGVAKHSVIVKKVAGRIRETPRKTAGKKSGSVKIFAAERLRLLNANELRRWPIVLL
ncbi:MAG: hypothetical protein NPIRA02_05760 [Nitrospirales bacterium]|nr:MAG: hypothetical protein NPIRA02_05760 [Nitrospirales bacterium]